MELNEALGILRKHKKDFEAYQRVEEALESALEARKLRVDEDKKKSAAVKENAELRSEMMKLRNSLNGARVHTGAEIKDLEDSIVLARLKAERSISVEKKNQEEQHKKMIDFHHDQRLEFEADTKLMKEKRSLLKSDISSLEKRMDDLRGIVAQMSPA